MANQQRDMHANSFQTWPLKVKGLRARIVGRSDGRPKKGRSLGALSDVTPSSMPYLKFDLRQIHQGLGS